MEALPLTLLFLFLSFILSSNTVTSKWVSGIRNIGAVPDSNRRILHEPLFPVGSAPPPAVEPPPPENSDIPDPDHPFFPEVPTGLSPGQTQTTPTRVNISTTPAPLATQPANSTKKYGIAISAGIVTLGMLSALVFYLYRHRAKHPSETQKLVGGNSQQEPSMPASDCLYLGTMEPSNQRSGEVNGIMGSSSYHKLGSVRMSEQYQPSPELQPMPQLNRAPSRTSPSMSSDDDTFYTSHDSSVGNGEIRYTTTQHQIPQSRRSPKSHFSISSPEVKHAIVQTSTPPPPPPLPPLLLPTQQPRLQYSQPRTPSPPKRKAKFPAPASPPTDLVLPPAPPPPPTTATPWKVRHSEISASKNQIQALPKTQPQMPNTKATTRAEIPTPIAEVNQCGSSIEHLNMGEDVILAKPRLKPLHWDKVRATSDRATVWDQLKSSSFKLNEDMIESLFGCNSTNQAQKEPTTKSIRPPVQQEERVLDPKKSQNIAILLRALNVTRDEVSEALLDGNPEHLGPELLETMVKMAPTKEEELKLRDYGGELSKLGSAERFLKALLDIPFAFKRVDAMLYRANFDTEVKYLRKSFETLEVACEELKNSRLFLKLLEAVLRTGNRMNVGTNRGDAKAFKLDTLLKLVEVKGTDGKTTLLHFVVQEIIRSEGEGSNSKPENLLNKMHPKMEEENFNKQGLQVVAGLSRDLGNVKKAAGMDSDVLRGYLTKLEMGLGKVRMVLQYEKSNTQGKFFGAMKLFLNEAEEEILQVKADERKALSLVKEVTEYFHGDTVKEGAHPFRIFMIVRDFLSVLDQVCKEVRKMQEGAIMGSARSFRISASVSLPVLNRFNTKQDSSAEDSLSP